MAARGLILLACIAAAAATETVRNEAEQRFTLHQQALTKQALVEHQRAIGEVTRECDRTVQVVKAQAAQQAEQQVERVVSEARDAVASANAGAHNVQVVAQAHFAEQP